MFRQQETLRVLPWVSLLIVASLLLGCEPQVMDDDDTPAALSVEGLDLDTNEDVALDFELPFPDGAISNLLSYTILSGPEHGELSGQGALRTYTPDLDYHGADSFRFEVREEDRTAEAEVFIEVVSVPDAPVAESDEVTLEEDGSVSVYVLANDYDPEGDDFGVIAVGTPVNGVTEIEENGTVRYTPDADFHGSDAFTYVVEDETGLSSSGDVDVTVTPVADGPVAVDDEITILEDVESLVAVLSNDYHPDDLVLSLDSVGEASYGTTSLEGESVRYIPANEFQGEDTFTYVMSDSLGQAASATVIVTVSSSADAPNAVLDVVSVDEDTPTVFHPLANDSDPEGEALSLDSVTNPTNGYATPDLAAGTITYTPFVDYFGTDSFTYVVSDESGLSSVGQVTVNVASINDAPAGNDLTVATSVGSMVVISVDAIDVENDSLTFLVTTQPSLGVVGSVTSTGVDSAQFSYTPSSAGVDTIGLTVTDPSGGLGSLQVTLENGGAPVTLSGNHTFDTDTGELDQVQVNDWNGTTWFVGDFAVLPGATLSVTGSAGLQIEVVGDAEVLGLIDVAGADGGSVSSCDNVPAGAGGAPGAGGYSGGSGAPTMSSLLNGSAGLGVGGGGGGISGSLACGGAGGGHQIAGGAGLRSDGLVLIAGGSPYTSLPPLQGGSGGGGGSVEPDGSTSLNDSGAGGGGGGGAVSITATGDITVGVTGMIDASGGDGGSSSCTSGGGSGGGGAGGGIELLGGTLPTVNGVLDVLGGLGNATNGPGGDGGDGYLVVGTTN